MFPHPEEPGVGPFVQEQVKILRDRGIDARVISGRPFPFFLRRPLGVPRRLREYRQTWTGLGWQDCGGVPVLYVPYHVGWLARFLRLDDAYRDAVLRAAQRVHDEFDFDLIHAHSSHPDGYAALAVSLRVHRPFVITEHTNPFSILTRTAIMRGKTLTAVAEARRVWGVSHALTQEIGSYFRPEQRSHIRTLFNGVDTSLFAPPWRWQPNPVAPRFLFVGFLVEAKNVTVLVEAFARIKQALPAARLDIAGSGPLRCLIERQIAALGLSQAVQLHGHCNRDQVAALMRESCDILVLPSQCETFGVVLIEALASGKPVVATRCGGPESIITHPSLGAMCPPNDAGALAHCLLVTTARLTSFDPAALRAHARRTFDLSILADQLLDQYKEIARDWLAGAPGAAA
jgi:glycosyltransferase involved in cell wall biosynthesis